MNSLTVVGNVGKDAEIRFLPNGDPVCSFSVADSQGRDKPAIWWACSLYGKRAESLAQYITKGIQVTVVGHISEREWTDKDGNKRKSMEIRVNDIALPRRENSGQDQQQAPAQRQAAAKQDSGFDDMDDSIPF